MKFKVYTEAEKAAWLKGKISSYYANRSRERRKKCCSGTSTKVKYSTYSSEDAFARALERTYGPNSK